MSSRSISILYDYHDHPIFFQGHTGNIVTASDTAELQPGMLYIGSGGNLTVTTRGGSVLPFVNVPDGTFLPMIVIKVHATGLTASNILILR